MEDRFSKNEFVSVNHFPSKAFHAVIGRYLIRLWAGKTAGSIPRENLPSISDYTHFEVAIYFEQIEGRNKLSYGGKEYCKIDIDNLNLVWENERNIFNHGQNQSVSFIRSLMKHISSLEGINISSEKEKPCRQCGKPNDLGVAECWWCCCSNPV